MKKRECAALFTLILCLSAAGCTPLECFRTVWGSSVRALDAARKTGISGEFECSKDRCFDVVLQLTSDAGGSSKKQFDLFQKNRKRGYIVVMGIPGNIDTTEAGIFFVEQEGRTLVEVSSLSSHAKRTVAETVFETLRSFFPQVRP